MERNLLEVKKLSEVLQTSCTPEGQSALSQDLQPLFGKTLDQKKILEDERTLEGNSDPVQSSIQCSEPQQPGVSTEEKSVQVSFVSLLQRNCLKTVMCGLLSLGSAGVNSLSVPLWHGHRFTLAKAC